MNKKIRLPTDLLQTIIMFYGLMSSRKTANDDVIKQGKGTRGFTKEKNKNRVKTRDVYVVFHIGKYALTDEHY